MKHNIYLYILIMATVTYLIRALPLTCIRKKITNVTLRSFLYYVPYVTLSIMTTTPMTSVTLTPLRMPPIVPATVYAMRMRLATRAITRRGPHIHARRIQAPMTRTDKLSGRQALTVASSPRDAMVRVPVRASLSSRAAMVRIPMEATRREALGVLGAVSSPHSIP